MLMQSQVSCVNELTDLKVYKQLMIILQRCTQLLAQETRAGGDSRYRCRMQQCQHSAYLNVIQVVNVELGNGSAPNCDIDGLGGRGIRLHQHHSQILVNLQMHKLTHRRVTPHACLCTTPLTGLPSQILEVCFTLGQDCFACNARSGQHVHRSMNSQDTECKRCI